MKILRQGGFRPRADLMRASCAQALLVAVQLNPARSPAVHGGEVVYS